jgi:hypothetical protein
MPSSPRVYTSMLDHDLVQPEPNSGCWLWVGSQNSLGYGCACFNGKKIGAHRMAWIIANGVRPPKHMFVCHRCNNPSCVNPDHLFLAPQKDNMRHMVQCDRHARGERSASAKLTANDVRTILMRHEAGESQHSLAREYGINQGHISHIKRRRFWRHLAV